MIEIYDREGWAGVFGARGAPAFVYASPLGRVVIDVQPGMVWSINEAKQLISALGTVISEIEEK